VSHTVSTDMISFFSDFIFSILFIYGEKKFLFYFPNHLPNLTIYLT
jgi:hypothetical protein